MNVSSDRLAEMWKNSCSIVRLVASSVRVSETAGSVIKASELFLVHNFYLISEDHKRIRSGDCG